MFNISIASSETTIPVNWDAMPEASKRYIIAYGLKQRLNDAGASFKKDEEGSLEKKLAAAQVVLEGLMEGNITVRQAAVSMSLEQREFLKILKKVYKQVTGKKADDLEADAMLAAIAETLGKDADSIEKKLLIKAKEAADLERKIKAIKAETSLTIDI